MPENKQIFSVVIPVFNGERTIERLLFSLIPQKNYLKEVLICNDNSTDKTVELVSKYEKRLPIKILTVPKGEKGSAAARNIGIQNATGAWITFADADDAFVNQCFEKIYKESIKEPQTEVFGTAIFYTDEKMKITNFSKQSIIYTHGKFYKKTFLIKNNLLFNKNFYTNDDVEFNYRVIFTLLYKHDQTIEFKDIYSYYFVQRPDSLTAKIHEGKYNFFEKYMDDYVNIRYNLYKEYLGKSKELDNLIINFYFQTFVALYALLSSHYYIPNSNERKPPLKENFVLMKKYYDGFKTLFNIDKKQILQYFNNHFDLYLKALNSDDSKNLIPLFSLYDFINILDSNKLELLECPFTDNI